MGREKDFIDREIICRIGRIEHVIDNLNAKFPTPNFFGYW